MPFLYRLLKRFYKDTEELDADTDLSHDSKVHSQTQSKFRSTKIHIQHSDNSRTEPNCNSTALSQRESIVSAHNSPKARSDLQPSDAEASSKVQGTMLGKSVKGSTLGTEGPINTNLDLAADEKRPASLPPLKKR